MMRPHFGCLLLAHQVILKSPIRIATFFKSNSLFLYLFSSLQSLFFSELKVSRKVLYK